MSFKEIQMSVQIVVPDPQAHAGLFRAIITKSHTADHRFFSKRSIVIVHKEQTGSGVAGYVNIRTAVFVQVSRDDGHAVAFYRTRDACLLADVDECPIAPVAVWGMPAGRHPAGPAFHGHALPVAIYVLAGHWSMLEREANVIGDEEIEIAIAVVVN